MLQLGLAYKLVYILLTFILSFASMQEITYHLVEENRKGFVLGNLNHFITNDLKTDAGNIEFLITSNFFDIENESKNVIVKMTIDLDTLCVTDSLCCNDGKCVIPTKVVIQQKRQYSGTFLLKVEILDANDNLPVFLEPKQTIKISENIQVNTSISIEGAIDKDFSQIYRQKSYDLIDESATFLLSVLASVPELLNIVVNKPLDFESRQQYQCQLKVCDAVFKNCVKKSIVIDIIDENDNYPIFLVKKYVKSVPENFTVGKEILRVQAIDKDSEKYNNIKYGFVSSYEVSHIFFINPTSGGITLKRKLSANVKEKYAFKVFAMDASSVSFKKDFADVEISIDDVNDHEPVIALLRGYMPDFYSVNVDENSPPKELFSIQVSDQDKGRNGVVKCSLEPQQPGMLHLKLMDKEIYQIQTLIPYDYEETQSILAQIVCTDDGDPKLLSRKGFRVIINDINEFVPMFKQNKVELSVNENLREGKVILKMEATDRDKGAILLYSLDSAGNVHFKINSKSGEITTTKVSLDRETRDKIQFKVLVTDSAQNPKTATALVLVVINDQNDNAPKFVNTRKFMIPENQYVYTKLSTKIEAIDNDIDENNKSILFRLINTFNSRMELVHDQIFDVNSKGEIETMSIIDREKDDNFTLTVIAQDHGRPSLSTSTNITIFILDINDNTPVWVYPDSRFSRDPEAVINVTKNSEQGSVIALLKATDLDTDDAGKITYQLLGDSSSFTVNKSSGVLSVGNDALSYGTSHLRVRAQDGGQPQLFRDATLIVHVVQSNDTIFSSLNMVIIVGMLAITAVISLFLIVAIIFIRRSPAAPTNLPCNVGSDDKMQRSPLEISCQNLFENKMEKEPIFSDYTVPQYHWINQNMASNLLMYPQSSSDGGCTTYVRFATPNTFGHEVDVESADSGKGTSDLEMNLQSTIKGSVINPYNHVQFIPSSNSGYLVPNDLRLSYQIINESDKIDTPTLHNFVKQQNMLYNVQGHDLKSHLGSYQEIPFSSLPPYRS